MELKTKHQDLFFKYEVLKKENSALIARLNEQELREKSVLNENKHLRAKLSQLRRISTPNVSKNIDRVANINTTVSTPNIISTPKRSSTPKPNSLLKGFSSPKTSVSTPKVRRKKKVTTTLAKKTKKTCFEVAKLIDHDENQESRLYLVRWKGFTSKDDTWEREANLSCPKILDAYKKKHKLH